MHALAVGEDRREVARQVVVERHARVGPSHLDLGEDLRDERGELDALAFERDVARLEPRQVEELVHEPAQPLGLHEHDLQRLGVGLLDTVEQVLQMRPQRRDRRLELVGDVRDQLAAQQLEPLELGAHPVEGVGQLADLVARVRHDPLRVVARLHASGGPGHVAQRLRHAARDPPGDHERDPRAEHPGEQQLPPVVADREDLEHHAEDQVHQQQGHPDREHDDRPELGPDRRQPLEERHRQVTRPRTRSRRRGPCGRTSARPRPRRACAGCARRASRRPARPRSRGSPRRGPSAARG